MSNETYAERLYEWFKNGPRGPEEDGTIAFFIAMFLWWRMLAQFLLLGVSVIAVLWAGYWVGEGPMAALVGFFIGLLVGGWTKHLSPKYNVEKNY